MPERTRNNVDAGEALAPVSLEPALTAAGVSGPVPTPAAPSAREFPRLPHRVPRSIGLAAVTSIRNQYDPAIDAVHATLAAVLHQPAPAIEIEPNFLETYHALPAVKRAHAWWARGKPRDGSDGRTLAEAVNWPLPFPMPAQLDAQVAAWEMRLGELVCAYFASVANRLRTEGFAGDERLCGDFLAAVPRRRLAFRLVEAVPAGQHSDVAVENGTLYVQTTVNAFGRAVERTADRVVERLGSRGRPRVKATCCCCPR